MNSIKINFLHPTDGRIVTVTVDEGITASEAVAELIANNFIAPAPQGYRLAVKGGDMLRGSHTLAESGVKDGDTIRIIPKTEAGGGDLNAGIKSAVPGLRKNSTDTFTIQDIQSSPQAIIMLVNMFDDIQLKYEQQSKQLEHERARSNDRFVAALLLVISQIVLSIGTNLLTSSSKIAIPVMIAGAVQSALALYLTFRKRREP